MDLADAFSGLPLHIETVDETSSEHPPRGETLNDPNITLAPCATAIVEGR